MVQQQCLNLWAPGGMTVNNKLVIIGAGGFGREASLLVEEINEQGLAEKLNLAGFIDEENDLAGQNLRGYPVLGSCEALTALANDCRAICVVGDPSAKRKLVKQAKKLQVAFINLVHPSVELAQDVTLGCGVLINKGCLLTINISIGEHVSINPGCSIGHDSIIGSYSTLMWRVNISGNVQIGEGCLIGSGATVLQGLKIGRGVTIGAGAVVTKDLPDGCTAVGVPAQLVEQPGN